MTSGIASAIGEIGAEAKNTAHSIAADLGDKVAGAATDHKDEAADALDQVADVLKRSAEGLDGQQDWIAGIVEAGASELGSLATTLRANDLQALLGSLQDLARRQPAIFVGAAMAAGFAAVRLGKVAVAGATRADLPNLAESDNGRG